MRDYSALHIPAAGRPIERPGFKTARRRLRPDMGAELIAAVGIIVLFTVCGAVYYCAGLLSSPRFYSSITIDSVAVGGLTKAEAVHKFSELEASTPRALEVVVDGKSYLVTAKDIAAQYNVEETVNAAYQVGRKGNVLQKLGDILALRSEPQVFMFTEKYDEEKLAAAAARIASSQSVAPRAAALQFQPDSAQVFTITPEAEGVAVSADSLLKLMKAELAKSAPGPIKVTSQIAKPDVTAAALKNQTQLLASYTTALTADAVRNKNIRLAAAAVNGKVLYSGDEFSFNALTGARTADKGYVEAPTISNSQLVDAPGGGVCQVSSTVYNAALVAGLNITERHHHTWPMSYVPAGMDATVDYGTKDLKFKNDGKTPVYLVVKVDEAKNMITADFYGLPGDESISVTSTNYQVLMPPKPVEIGNGSKSIGWTRVINQAREGCTVSIFRVFTQGTDTRRELVSEDYYPPQQGKVEIGTKSSGYHGK